MVRWLAWPTAAVNTFTAGLAAAIGDSLVALVGLFGAGFAIYAWIYYTEELDHMAGEKGYRDVAMRLRWEIKEESRYPGERLENMNTLADRLGTTRTTIARALRLLEEEGLVQRIQGRGTYVVGEGGYMHLDHFPRDAIERAIRDGLADAPAGTPIAHTQDIVNDFGCSYQTVRRVQLKLANEGLLRRTQSGHYVKA